MNDLEHPEIGWIERTGYPSWAQPDEDDCDPYDADFEEDVFYDEDDDYEAEN